MTAAAIITLEGQPQGKARPRFTRRGIAYTPARTRSYEALLRAAGQSAMAGRPPIEGPLAVRMEAVFAVPSSWPNVRRLQALSGAIKPTGKPDADNLVKCCDALNGVAWRDDAQLVDVRVLKRYGPTPGLRIEVGAA